MENNMEVLKTNFFWLPCDTAISLLGIYPKKTKTLIQKFIHYMHPTVHYSIIYNCQDMEAT